MLEYIREIISHPTLLQKLKDNLLRISKEEQSKWPIYLKDEATAAVVA